MKTILITGADGFLAKYCIELLENKYKIITTDKTGSVDIKGDLSNCKFINSLPITDIVINCAAVQYVSKDIPLFFRRKYFFKNNTLVSKNLFEKYKELQTKFIHIGTSMMYEQTGQDIYTTKSKMQGKGVYSESKLSSQHYIEQIKNQATVIPCIIGGKGREGLFTGFVNLIKKYSIVFYPGKGQHLIHMVHAKDVATLIEKIIKKNGIGFFNAASPEPLSIQNWVDEIANTVEKNKVAQIKLPLFPLKLISKILGYRLLAREQLLMLEHPHVLDITESLNIGWKPSFTNKEIVRDLTRGLLDEK